MVLRSGEPIDENFTAHLALDPENLAWSAPFVPYWHSTA